MRIVLASVISTKAATTRTTIRVTIENPLFEYERGRALDLGHFHARARLERLPLEERARRPFLASDPDASAVDINSLEHHRLRADEGGGPRTDQRRHVDVALRDRPQERERRERDRDVVLGRVADHNRGGRLDLEPLEGGLEDGRMRLRLAVDA